MVKKEETLDKRLDFPRYETLKMLQEGLSISEIAKYRHISRQAVYDILSTMNKKGLVAHPKRSVYHLTDKGTHTLHSFVALRYKLRQHNLHFKINIQESPRNWEQKRKEIRFMPYYNKTLKLKNNEQELLNFGKLQIKTTSKSIIIKVPTIYAVDWESALIQAMQILEDSLYKIENLFKIRLVQDYKSNITIISNEYARIQDALAKLYRHEGNRIYLTGNDGKIWMITDFSFSTDELEFIHTTKATDDIDAIAPFFNDLRENPTTLSNIREETNKVLEVAKAHAINLIKHQKVLDEIIREFREFKEWRKKHG